MSDLDSESEVNGIIRKLRSELADATEIGFRWMGNYKDKEKECDELRSQLDNVTRQLDSLYKAAGEKP